MHYVYIKCLVSLFLCYSQTSANVISRWDFLQRNVGALEVTYLPFCVAQRLLRQRQVPSKPAAAQHRRWDFPRHRQG